MIFTPGIFPTVLSKNIGHLSCMVDLKKVFFSYSRGHPFTITPIGSPSRYPSTFIKSVIDVKTGRTEEARGNTKNRQ